MDDATGIWHPERQRRCPRCTYPLTVVEYKGAAVDHCHRCGGTAVEPGNIGAHFGEWARPEHWLTSLAQQTTGETLRCPVDAGRMAGFQVPFGGRSVVIDHCEDCGCLWFDRGEGEKLVSIVRDAQRQGGIAAIDEELRNRQTAANEAIDTDLARQQDTMGKPGVKVYVFQLLTGLPVEVWNPVRGRTIAMKTVFWFIITIFAAQVVFRLTSSEEAARQFIYTFGLVPDDVLRGQKLWGFVTHMFLHGGVFHLVGNAYFLWIFGDNIEDRIGTNRFVLIFLLAGLAGAILHVAFDATPEVPAVGASGAIAGLMGAYLMLFPKVKLWIVLFFMHWRVPVWVYLAFWAAIQVAGVYFETPGIAWWAHIGGFAVGLGLGYIFRDVLHPLAPRERRVVA